MARFGRAQKASALLPLAVLSAAWTAGLATAHSGASASADPQELPDGSRVPAQAVKVPASLTPLSFPLWAERSRGQLSTEDWRARVMRAAAQLERRHGT